MVSPPSRIRAQSGPALEAGQDNLPNRGREIPLNLGLLGQIADLRGLQPVGEGNAALLRGFQSQQPLDQRGLAGAVFPHHAEIVPGVQRKVYPFQHPFALIGKAKVFTFQYGHQPKAALSVLRFCSISPR